MPQTGSRRSRRTARSTSTAAKEEEECPFCSIARANPPKVKIPPYSTPSTDPSYKRTETHMILSTPQVIGFLDIMPPSPGHVLLTPRHHAEKIMDLTPEEGASLGAWLPIITRAVSRAMQVEDLNVVQNNGTDSESPEDCRVNVGWGRKVLDEVKGKVEGVFSPAGARASQVVKHVHYHIIPRPESYTPSKSWTMFGKGARSDMDDDEAALIAAKIRQEIAWEMERMGNSQDSPVVRTHFLTPKL